MSFTITSIQGGSCSDRSLVHYQFKIYGQFNTTSYEMFQTTIYLKSRFNRTALCTAARKDGYNGFFFVI